MLKIALTGGIGTGKTYLSKHFIEMGIPVFYADEEAKKLYSDSIVLLQIKAKFGTSVFSNQQIDFAKLAALVFSDSKALEWMNRLIHPIVLQLFDQWSIDQNTPTVMMESAIIYEAHLEGFFDKIIVVDAPLQVRIERIKKRSPHLKDEEIMKRIEAQISQEEKCKRADLVLLNN
ncbi:MAG: dephospho-CoA kinase CoaE [Bacteroidetes bacterium]|nr:dephospho-CoA kinase CoaE [Bacteroidota bacterium]